MKKLEEEPQTYENKFTKLTKGLNQKAKSWIIGKVKLNSKILEVGCGSGFLSISLAQKGCNVVAFDQNKNMIAIAQQNLAESKIERSNIRFLEAKQVFKDFLGEIHNVTTPLIVCLHKIDIPKSLENVEQAKKTLEIKTECQRTMFYLQTTINRSETIDLIRYLMQLMISKEFKQGCTDGIPEFNQP